MDFNAAKRYWKKGKSKAQNTPLRQPRGHIRNVPEQCGSWGLSERLQQLYSDMIGAREEPGAADAGAEAPSLESNSRGFAMTDPSTTQDVEDGQAHKPAQVPPEDVLSLTQRPAIVVSKAKKRKAKGLFT